MTTEQKFNYIKNFSTLNIFGDIYYAIPIKDKKKRENSLQKSYFEIDTITQDIFVSSGYFVLDRSIASPDAFVKINSTKQIFEYFYEFVQNMEFTSTDDDIDTISTKNAINIIEKQYNTLIEFENKVKLLNRGVMNNETN